MSEVELLEYDIAQKVKSEYPNASKRALEATIQKEKERILDEYNITSDNESDVEIGLELLKMKMDKVREELKSQQLSYAPPKYEAKQEVDPQQIEAQKEMEKVRNELVSYVESNQELLDVERTKTIEFADDFKVLLADNVNIREQTLDINKFLTPLFDNGKLNMNKWKKLVAIAVDPDKVIKDAINYGKSLQEKEEFEKSRGIKNPINDAVPDKSGYEPVIKNVRYTQRN
jgi:response regulator RpfG family c-di-GMP phosphodiesterase